MPSSKASELAQFRADIRQFLQNNVPADIAAAVRAHCLVTREQAKRWQSILHDRGWAAPGWPREHGGPGWSLTEQALFREELAASDAPRFENLGIDTIGPTLIRHATPEQCTRFLPSILSFDDFWAQAYSEPGAGSDLAALRTRATRDGDGWVVNGTKIWQSYGHWANWALVLVRTDSSASRKQDGISVLLIDLQSPGVTVRPIRFMNGSVLHVEMFFDDVHVPAENLIGVENEGWRIAKSLLVIERLFVARVAECKAELHKVASWAHSRIGRGGNSLMAEDYFARRYAELEIRTRAVNAAWWPAVQAAQQGQTAELEASLLKLQGTELLQDIQQLQLSAVGLEGLPFDPSAITGTPSEQPFASERPENLALHMWRYRGITLGAGTSEVQRQIIAKAILGGHTLIDQSDDATLGGQQSMLDDSLRRLLHDRYAFEQRRHIIETQNGTDPAVWNAMMELGITGLMIPERDNGFGGSMADIAPLMQALGESLMLEPVLWCNVLTTQLVVDASNYAYRAERLDALLQGQRVALAHIEDRARPDTVTQRTTAGRDGLGWCLEGQKYFAMGGDAAQRFIVSARLQEGGMALFDVAADQPGMSVRRYSLHDNRGAADIALDKVRLPDSAMLAGPERASAMLHEAHLLSTLALCAENIGVMRRALALTLEHLRTRKQFGRALAEHQALQHRVVEHFRGWFNARALLNEAISTWPGASSSEQQRSVSAAKFMSGTAGRGIALDCLQLHGAVGLQYETPISHYAKRLMANEVLLGDTDTHLNRFMQDSRQQPLPEDVSV